VDIEKAKEIVAGLKKWRKQEKRVLDLVQEKAEKEENTEGWYEGWATKVGKAVDWARPLVVGVFANNDVEYVTSVAEDVGLDLIQLSGKEELAVIEKMNLPTWKALHVSDR